MMINIILSIFYSISTDADASLRIESLAIINFTWCSHKTKLVFMLSLLFYIIIVLVAIVAIAIVIRSSYNIAQKVGCVLNTHGPSSPCRQFRDHEDKKMLPLLKQRRNALSRHQNFL